MAAVLDLEAQLASLKRKEADLKAEARRASKKQKRLDGDHHVAQVLHSASVSQKVPNLAKSMLHVICDMLILFQLSDFSNEVVVSYALGLGKPPRFQNHGYSDMWDSDLRSSLSYGFDLFFTSYDIAFLTDNLANCADSRLATLCKYILEYKLFLWMVELNCEKGVHPPTAQLLVQAVRFIPVLAPAAIREKLKAYFSKMGSTAYQWAASFVERWPGIWFSRRLASRNAPACQKQAGRSAWPAGRKESARLLFRMVRLLAPGLHVLAGFG